MKNNKRTGIITTGNMKNVVNSIKQGKNVCVVYDGESLANTRNFILYPTEEEKEALKLIGGHVNMISFTYEMYADTLEMLTHYNNENEVVFPAYFAKSEINKPSLSFCSEDMLKHPVKALIWLQFNFDVVYLL